MRLILASSSPYRRQLLERLGIPFLIQSPDIDESPLANETPQQLALRLSRAKADKISLANPQALVIGSDQVAEFEGRAIGKPGDFSQARDQLRQFSDKVVIFHSALCVSNGAHAETRNVVTECRFRPLTHEQIECYLRMEQPYDTAGSAKAEGLGISLMRSLRSDDPTAIIGLPLIALCDMLRAAGLDPLHPSAHPSHYAP